ncbi:MAG: hypothetical protein HY525_11865 [Betaproteobacteria bacterium]|nr:hypothetical protein [Betaproteobacteria bacterium]
MPYAIILAREAAEDLEELKANVRAKVRDGLETHLSERPSEESAACGGER